jgi:hypothetical protein
MHMSLYWGIDIGPVVFGWWTVEGPWGLAATLSGVFLAAFIREFVSRRCLKMQIPNILKMLVYSLNTILTIFIMLTLMTFNGFVLLAVVLGATIGYYLFYSESSNDPTDECLLPGFHC